MSQKFALFPKDTNLLKLYKEMFVIICNAYVKRTITILFNMAHNGLNLGLGIRAIRQAAGLVFALYSFLKEL